MTPQEAYAVFGVSEPIPYGKLWAENIWGVDGLPLQLATRLIEQEAGRLTSEIARRGGAPLVASYIEAFTVSAKARLFDLYMSQQHWGTA